MTSWLEMYAFCYHKILEKSSDLRCCFSRFRRRGPRIGAASCGKRGARFSATRCGSERPKFRSTKQRKWVRCCCIFSSFKGTWCAGSSSDEICFYNRPSRPYNSLVIATSAGPTKCCSKRPMQQDSSCTCSRPRRVYSCSGFSPCLASRLCCPSSSRLYHHHHTEYLPEDHHWWISGACSSDQQLLQPQSTS